MSAFRKIGVFISSNMTELEYDREIAQQELRNMNINPVVFEVFPALSESPSRVCHEEVGSCDILVMLLWKSLRRAVEEEYTEALKQNKPILILVKSLIESEEREQALKEFLSSLSSDSAQHPSARVTYKTYRRINELREAVRESVGAEIAKIYKEPIYTVARDEMYELGTSIVRDAERRLYLFQRTPSLILSSRNYLADDSMKYAYEKTFEDVLQTWVRNNCGLADRKFLYLFSPEATRREIENKQLASNATYLTEVKSRIQRLTDIEVQSGYRFRIAMVDVPSMRASHRRRQPVCHMGFGWRSSRIHIPV